MRQIKFRVWDKKAKEWIYWEEFTKNPGILGFILTGKTTDSVINQFTGLLDKNGKEIYEGDIVKLDTWAGVQQIAFIEGAFCLANSKGEYVGDIHYIHHAGIEQATVTGNIYSNPELLEEKKEGV